MRRRRHVLLAPVALVAACWPGPRPTPSPDRGGTADQEPMVASGGESGSDETVDVERERGARSTAPIAAEVDHR